MYAEEFKDISTVYTETLPRAISIGLNGALMLQGMSISEVVVSQTRKAQIGDKFAALHAQKGTIGKIVASEDLPFTQDGIIPDALINPLAFPESDDYRYVRGVARRENSVPFARSLVDLSAKEFFLTRGTPFDPLVLSQVERELS